MESEDIIEFVFTLKNRAVAAIEGTARSNHYLHVAMLVCDTKVPSSFPGLGEILV